MFMLSATSKTRLQGHDAPRRGRFSYWRLSLAGAVLIGLLGALLPLAPAAASGPIWLPTEQVTFSKVDNESTSMATYHNHAYILWVEGDLSHPTYWVYYTTNASGKWTTQLLSKAGPGTGGVDGTGRVRIAVDPTLNRLYAVWSAAGVGGKQGSVVLYTSGDEGTTWQGPTTLAHSDVSTPFPNIALAVGGGKAAVGFVDAAANFGKGACKNVGTNDLFVVTYNGTTWSSPQNVSSCADSITTNNGWRVQRLAYDETSGRFALVALDGSNNYGLWYARGSGTSWSTPAPTPMSHVIAGDMGGPEFQVAAAGGTTYVDYGFITTPGKAWCCVDVYLGMKQAGQAWTTQRMTQDRLDCEKADVSLAARPGRIALAYRWFYGNCATPEPPSGPHAEYIHVLTGQPGQQPGQFQEAVVFTPSVPSNCRRPVLSTDGDLFRVLQTCINVGSAAPGTNLYYTSEYLDVVGPTTRITGIRDAGPAVIRVSWMAQDPTPGSGVAYFMVQVSDNGGPWQTLAAKTNSLYLDYKLARTDHTYTFQVRARDKANNWGPWVSAKHLEQHGLI